MTISQLLEAAKQTVVTKSQVEVLKARLIERDKKYSDSISQEFLNRTYKI